MTFGNRGTATRFYAREHDYMGSSSRKWKISQTACKFDFSLRGPPHKCGNYQNIISKPGVRFESLVEEHIASYFLKTN